MQAEELGLGELGFADHNPMPEQFDNWRMSIDDLPRYLDSVAEARQPDYDNALKAIDADPNQEMFVVEDAGKAIGCFQLSYLPGLMRRGMWRVVNEKGGTADVAKLSGDVVLCGKTGSAQAVGRVLSRRYEFTRADGKKKSIEAPSR